MQSDYVMRILNDFCRSSAVWRRVISAIAIPPGTREEAEGLRLRRPTGSVKVLPR